MSITITRDIVPPAGAVSLSGGGGVWNPSTDSDLGAHYSGGILESPISCRAGAVRAAVSGIWAIHERLAEMFDQEARRADFQRQVLGLNPWQAQVFTECLLTERSLGIRAAVVDAPMLRADLLCGTTGFSLVELNYTSACGGFDEEMVTAAVRGRGTDDHAPGSLERNVLDAILGLLRSTGGEPGTVALVDSAASYATYEPRLEVLRRLLAARGITAVHGTLDSLTVMADGSLTHSSTGERIDTVWRFFMLDEIEHEADVGALRPVLNAWRARRVALFSSFVEEAKSSKALLAGLWADPELRSSGLVVPTYRVSADGAERDGAVRLAVADARRRPDEWVLKSPFGHGGAGVLLGWQTPAHVWSEHLELALRAGRPAVLQRRVYEVPYVFDAGGSGRPSVVGRVNLGLFLAQRGPENVEGYGGSFVRIALESDSKIGISQGAVCAALVTTGDNERRSVE